MHKDLISMIVQSEDKSSVLEIMAQTAFDELIVLDLQNDTFHSIYHVTEKFSLPVLAGGLSSLYDYCSGHLVHPDDEAAYRAFMNPVTMASRLEASDIPGCLSLRLRFRLEGGTWCWTEQVLLSGSPYGLPEGIVQLYIYDIRLQKERIQGRMELDRSREERDKITGLLVEHAFISQGKAMASTLQGTWCVLSIDIENFRLFCEWNGQDGGIAVLSDFGRILTDVCSQMGGLACYRGQDDFSLLCPYDMDLIRRLYDRLSYAIHSRSATVGFSPMIGICVLEEDVSFTDAFNHSALIAEEIKGDFRTRIKVFDAQKYEENTRHLRLLSDFQNAIDSGEITFYLQPQCRVSTRAIIGAESLARWQSRDGSWISPAYFVPILEKFGLITNLDQFIWESVCAWLRKIFDLGFEPVPISINVSRIDLFTLDVPMLLSNLMAKYRLPARYLKVEITESAYVDDTDTVKNVVARLREFGFMVMMDDFGSGYSSLNMLSTLNMDIIKLDAQFLHLEASSQQKGVSILESIINMTKMLETPIIVEGVETHEQVSFLSDLGCRYMQGFYFYQPMPLAQFEHLLFEGTNIDHSGIQFKANQEIHTREFLDANIFSDAMLNNVLGPVCFYNWHHNQVDITRFNQQFYLMLGIETDVLEERRKNILDYFVPEDVSKFISMLGDALEDRLNGAKGVFRVYKPNGTLFFISLRVYFISEDETGKKFYASAQDVTDTQFINRELPGAYYRCTLHDGYEFLFISESFLDMTGFTEPQIRTYFDNRLINMVHPDDAAVLIADTDRMIRRGTNTLRPFRLRHRNGGYIFVVESNRLTDRFGPLSWQCVSIDVTEMMRFRNQMELLADFFTDSIVFIHEEDGGTLRYEVVVHGLTEKLGIDKETLERWLNDGTFLSSCELPDWRKDRNLYWKNRENLSVLDDIITVRLPGREPFRISSRFNRVLDRIGNVGCVMALSAADSQEQPIEKAPIIGNPADDPENTPRQPVSPGPDTTPSS